MGLLAGCSHAGPEDSGLVALLFAGVGDHRTLSSRDRSDITAALGLELSDSGEVVDPYCGLPVAFEIALADLDADGQPEVRVQAGNACSAGHTGSTLWLFMRREGGFTPILMAPALGYKTRVNPEAALPDLELGGPGFCHPVWRWNGTEYRFAYRMPEIPGGCDPP